MRKEGAKFIAMRRRAGVIALCLVLALGVLAVMPADTRAQTAMETSLEDPNQVEGIKQAMRENWLAAWMMMTEQFVTTMMNQMFIVGTFFDAKQEMEVQRIYQKLTAEAHKDFQPSWQVCEFGTTVRSLSASEMVARENSQKLDSVMAKREHLHAGLASATGLVGDISNRVRQFKDVYCDQKENNRQMTLFCSDDGKNPTTTPVDRRSKDIDYPRLIGLPYTLDANYTDDKDTDTEKDILALSRNIYSSPIIDFIPEQLVNEAANQDLFMDLRSIQAIRSVARRSFTHIVGEKAEGDQNAIWKVRPFMYGIMKEMGVKDDELKDFLGENPSYFAQMELLTRKIYESPEFYTNLYDKPANVERTGVALQAIGLMQDRDRYESALRREMMISLILELNLRHYQEDVTNAMFSSINKKPDVAEGP